MKASAIPLSVDDEILYSNNELALQDDTLLLNYKKLRRSGKKARWRKGRVWVEGDVLSLFREELEELRAYVDAKDSASDIVTNPAVYQAHKIDLDYFLDNFLDENKYKSELDWAKIQKIEVKPFAEQKHSEIASENFIYGFHPYWMGNSYYNYDFNLYDRIGYFGYVIDPENGDDLSTAPGILAHSWVSSTIHEKASSYGCDVDLCVASYKPENNNLIFADTDEGAKIRAKLVTNLEYFE